MKAYPITEAHLKNLSLLDGVAGFLLSAATGCAVYVFDVSKDLALTSDAPESAVAFWAGTRIAATIFGVLATIGFAGAIYLRLTVVGEIKANTLFDDDEP